MVFHWGGHAWTDLTSTGIQQGSPPSAGLFALILGEALDALFCSWDTHQNSRARHRDAMGRPLHGWAFADDCILNFLGWSDYKKGFYSLLLAFEELGLSISSSKTYLIVHPSLLQDGLAYFRDDPDHPGFLCKWVQGGSTCANLSSTSLGPPICRTRLCLPLVLSRTRDGKDSLRRLNAATGAMCTLLYTWSTCTSSPNGLRLDRFLNPCNMCC